MRNGWNRTNGTGWTNEIEREQKAVTGKTGHMTLGQVLTNGRVLSLAAIYFTIVTATSGITFFLPQIVKGVGGSDLATGLITRHSLHHRHDRHGGLELIRPTGTASGSRMPFVACCLASVCLALAGKLGANTIYR